MAKRPEHSDLFLLSLSRMSYNHEPLQSFSFNIGCVVVQDFKIAILIAIDSEIYFSLTISSCSSIDLMHNYYKEYRTFLIRRHFWTDYSIYWMLLQAFWKSRRKRFAIHILRGQTSVDPQLHYYRSWTCNPICWKYTLQFTIVIRFNGCQNEYSFVSLYWIFILGRICYCNEL